MANPFDAQISKEEKLYAEAITKQLNKALAAKDLQKKADGLTSQSSKTPPKPVTAVFEKALAAELKKVNVKNPGLVLKAAISYKMNGASWIATVKVTAKYPMVGAGGATHRVKAGETLWAISKTHYGSGGYWPLIAKANAAVVNSKGNFILSGVDLKIPKIDVIKGISVPATIEKKIKPAKDSSKKARPVLLPTLEYDLDKSKTVTRTFKFPGLTMITKTTLKGTLKASRAGTVNASFNLKSFDAEIKKAAGPFEASVKINSFKPTEIQLASSVSGTLWKSSISITKTGAIKTTFASKPVSFKSGAFVFEGNVSIEFECQIIPDIKLLPEPKPVYEAAWEWLEANATVVVGGALVVGAGILVVATIGEDIATLGAGIADDPVSFAAAAAMFGRGLQMVR